MTLSQEIETIFPFPSFRDHQKDILERASYYLDQGKNVIIDAPTGIGKSPINVTLCERAESAYYTTPQRNLRSQLLEDPDLQEYYKVLRARQDYVCDASGAECDKCEFYTQPGMSCNDQGRECTYMRNVSEAVTTDTIVLTMSRLLIAGQKNFGQYLKRRELLVVDEAQSLGDQVASMHANIRFDPVELDPEVYEPVIEDVDIPEDDEEVVTQGDIWSEINEIQGRLNGFIDHNEGDEEMVDEVIEAKSILKGMQHLFQESKDDRTWVVEFFSSDGHQGMEIKPVKIDRFLARYFWSLADNVVLSSATVPYRGKEDIWLQQLGFNPDTFEVISVPSPFPPQNRLVHTRFELGKMSQEEDEIWDDAMEQLAEVSTKHSGERGLIHTASYDRGNKIKRDSKDYDSLHGNVMVDEPGDERLHEWLNSNKDILCSPSMTEGVDLAGDKCRWQVLFKVPYPHPDDPRVQKMLNDDRWYWYNQKAAVDILQSVGRAVRSKEDKADFYVFDSSFEDVRRSVTFPEWFGEAIC